MSWIGLVIGLGTAWFLAEALGGETGLVALGALTGVLLARLHRRVDTLEQRLKEVPLAQASPAMPTAVTPSATMAPPPPAPEPGEPAGPGGR